MEEFYELHDRNCPTKDKEQAKARFVNELQQAIQDQIYLFDLESVDVVHHRALKAESQYKRSLLVDQRRVELFLVLLGGHKQRVELKVHSSRVILILYPLPSLIRLKAWPINKK